MKKFRERKQYIMAAVSAVVFAVAGFIALDFTNLPLISSTTTRAAYFPTAVGLQNGDVVTVAGVRVGKVTGLTLAGNKVKVTFQTSGAGHLGSATKVNVKVINPVGVEYLELVPGGPGHAPQTISEANTTVPGTLIADLNQFTVQTQQTNLPQLVQSLEAITNAASATAPEATRQALTGVAALSSILAARSGEVTQLITQTNDLVSVLNAHSGALVDLVGQANAVLGVLQDRQAAVQTLLHTTSTLSGQLDHILGSDESSIKPLLDNLASVSQYLSAESGNLDAAIPQLAAFSKYAANALGSGPFGDFVTPGLLPDNLLKQCSSAAAVNPLYGCRP
jgi:phospholipid/cholesterol/gamma-HCH transport system substrate-binding protein